MKFKVPYIKAYISQNFLWVICAFVAVILCLTLFFALSIKADFNITSELFNLTQNIHHYYQKSPDYRGLNTSYAIENKIIPAPMIRQNKIYSLSKSEVLIGKDLSGETLLPMDRFFSITYLRINKKECLKIFETDFHEDSSLIGITIQNDKAYEFSYGGVLALPLSKHKAEDYCRSQNTIMFTFE